MELVVIGVPIYKGDLSSFERMALDQLNKVLSHYEKVFIAPDDLDFDYGNGFASWGVCRFPNRYFRNTSAYSELLLSVDFYKRFVAYEYMLIYQTDAFVFYDGLKEFCEMGYDYVGAPWNYVHKMLYKSHGYVGNGGFSLRKVSSVVSLLEFSEDWRACHSNSKIWYKLEDQFFAYCGAKKINGFCVAPSSVARAFAFNTNPRSYYRRNKSVLSFGCHGWYKADLAFYAPFLRNLGYDVQDEGNYFNNMDKHDRLFDIVRYRCNQYIKFAESDMRSKNEVEKVLPSSKGNRKYALWGYGADGEIYFKVLKKDKLYVQYIFDNNPQKEGEFIGGAEVMRPDLDWIKKDSIVVLISSSSYSGIIKERLLKAGLVENKDFVDLCRVMRQAMKQCVRVKKNVIIVPIYKEKLNELETVSLKRVVEILGKNDIVLVAPKSLDLQWYECFRYDFSVERFEDNCFDGFAGYNRLMLSLEFYERFAAYQYMLICQTDVFVFEDRLDEFCGLGYDYIGAPLGCFSGDRYRLCGGNGGFSLRNVLACINLLKKYREDAVFWRRGEDEFFSIYIVKTEEVFKVAPLDVAMRFAFDRYERYLFGKNGGKVPFALHGWYVHDVEFNKSLIDSYVSEDVIPWPSLENEDEEVVRFKEFFAQNDKVVFYGAGDWGKGYYEFCAQEGLPVELFVVSDDHKLAESVYMGMNICRFSEVKEKLLGCGIVLTMGKMHREAVKGMLERNGVRNVFEMSEVLMGAIGEWLLRRGEDIG